MPDWIHVKGFVKAGHGVASGKAKQNRFPHGTIAMQKPFFQQLGLDLGDYFNGTINLAIAPYQYQVKQAKYTFRDVKWSANDPAEDFSFFDCRVITNSNQPLTGLIYYPHPETKPEHLQPPDILEVLTPFIHGLSYGDELLISVKSQQMNIYK
ncbi:MAG: hypothetical protein AAGF24_08225 [Cyanobacteria bacterium P01_H01_bin.121]